MEIRTCRKCDIAKSLNEFRKKSRECKSCQRDRIRKWERENRDRKKVNALRSYAKLRQSPERWERYKATRRISGGNYAARIRNDCFAAYGGRVCACCGETEPRFLTMDHVNNDGHIHRKTSGATNLYSYLRARKFPEGFQVLCMNCNFGKAQNGGVCPHKSRQEGPETIAQASTLK
jgi:hypothetical protein